MVRYHFTIYCTEKASQVPWPNREKKIYFMTECHELFPCEMKENREALLEGAQQSLLEYKKTENVNIPPEGY